MSVWQRIRGFFSLLGFRRRATLEFDPLVFVPPDVDQLARVLKLQKLGAHNGKNEIPASTDTQLDGPQHKVVQHVQGLIDLALARARVRLHSYGERIVEIDLANNAPSIPSMTKEFRRALDALLEQRRHELDSLAEEQRSLREEFEEFKVRNRLSREPDYPESRIKHSSVVGIIFLAESALNGYFFALGHEFGVIGGVWFAILLAFADILLSFSLGRLSTWSVSPRLIQRSLGILATVAFLMWAGTYNLAAAHLRETLLTHPFEEAMRQALTTFATSIFGLTAADSWILFVLGTLFSVTAMLDGWFWDDPHPGYGRRHRRLVQTEEDLSSERLALFQDGEQQLAEHLAQLNEASEMVTDDLASLENAISTKRTLIDNFCTLIGSCERSCNALIAMYRDTNRSHRKTEPPAYFDHKWQHPVPTEFEIDLEPDRQKLGHQRSVMDRIEKERRAAINKAQLIHDAFQQNVDRYGTRPTADQGPE